MELKQNAENNAFYVAMFMEASVTSALFICTSFFGVIALSADRFLAIRFLFSYKELVTHKRVVVVVISIWLLSAFISLITLWTPRNIIYLIFAIIDLICEIAATCLTFKVYRAARSHLNELQAMELSVQQASQNGDMANVARLKKFAMLAVYVYVVFLVCYLPSTCLFWIISFTPERGTLTYLLQGFAGTLVFLNSTLNPVIYCLNIRSLGITITNMLRNVFCKRH